MRWFIGHAEPVEALIPLKSTFLYAGRLLLPACLSCLCSHLLQLTRAHLLPISVFALGIVAETPQAQRGVEADSPTRRGTPKKEY